ncbi:hypothetical protein MAF45_00215 [Mesosutterella sp. OilRF-GAM-744-9]|uniref:Uncharacterized protein n=1 Tax=Mesosutterella porci TaxID=2915351 RepID=A0ABS9MMX9_9BURK|nr:hypothetical protein [Mesosutterella sp. oilRF-744-WT-GAM-9]MCG5029882.1 hypothetical protein [Mesosutterella sp. oilRF-744-WT-GAM-9]
MPRRSRPKTLASLLDRAAESFGSLSGFGEKPIPEARPERAAEAPAAAARRDSMPPEARRRFAELEDVLQEFDRAVLQDRPEGNGVADKAPKKRRKSKSPAGKKSA